MSTLFPSAPPSFCSEQASTSPLLLVREGEGQSNHFVPALRSTTWPKS